VLSTITPTEMEAADVQSQEMRPFLFGRADIIATQRLFLWGRALNMPVCGGLSLSGHHVRNKPLYHSSPQQNREGRK